MANAPRDYCSLYVSNLHEAITDDLLMQIFHNFGKIVSVKIVRSPGSIVAEVTFEVASDARTAMEKMNAKIILGRPCLIKWDNELKRDKFTDMTLADSYVREKCTTKDKEIVGLSTHSPMDLIVHERMNSENQDLYHFDENSLDSREYLIEKAQLLLNKHGNNMLKQITEMCETFEDCQLKSIINNQEILQKRMEESILLLIEKEFLYSSSEKNTSNIKQTKQQKYCVLTDEDDSDDGEIESFIDKDETDSSCDDPLQQAETSDINMKNKTLYNQIYNFVNTYAKNKTEQVMKKITEMDNLALEQLIENENSLKLKVSELMQADIVNDHCNNMLTLAMLAEANFFKINDFISHLLSEFLGIDDSLAKLKEWTHRKSEEIHRLTAHRNDFLVKMDYLIKALQENNKTNHKGDAISNLNTHFQPMCFQSIPSVVNQGLINLLNAGKPNLPFSIPPSTVAPPQWPYYFPVMQPLNSNVGLALQPNMLGNVPQIALQNKDPMKEIKYPVPINQQTVPCVNKIDLESERKNAIQTKDRELLLKYVAENPTEAKQLLEKMIYPTVKKYSGNMAEKITKMLMQLENADLLNMIGDERLLRMKVEEVLQVWND